MSEGSKTAEELKYGPGEVAKATRTLGHAIEEHDKSHQKWLLCKRIEPSSQEPFLNTYRKSCYELARAHAELSLLITHDAIDNAIDNLLESLGEKIEGDGRARVRPKESKR